MQKLKARNLLRETVEHRRKRSRKNSRAHREGNDKQHEDVLDLPLQQTNDDTVNGRNEGQQQDELEGLLEQAANGPPANPIVNANEQLTSLLRQAKLPSASRAKPCSCPVCGKTCTGFNAMSQHIGRPQCVRIKDSALVMCGQCSTILYDGCALKKHRGNKICLSKAAMLKDLTDGGATILANASAQVAQNTARVVTLRQEIRVKALARAYPPP